MAVAVRECQGCGRDFEQERRPGRPRAYCGECRPDDVPRPVRSERAWTDEVAELDAQAEAMDREAEQLAALSKVKRAEAAKLRARAERIVGAIEGVRVRRAPTALERARDDGLLAAAGLAVEDLADGFGAGDLAGALGIREPRALVLVRALEELGKVQRHGDGWACYDAEETRARDFVISAQEFTADDMALILDMHPSDVAYYLTRFKGRGIVSNGGDVYRYVVPPDDSPRERPRRRPPELDPPAGTDAPKRGEPVRIVDHGQAAAAGGKHKMKLKQQAWERQQEAVRARAEEQRRRAKGGR